MARLLADEHIIPGVVRRLRLLGHEVGTVRRLITESRAGNSVPDSDVLLFASEHRYAVLTKNAKDFKALHQESGGHFGIVACTFDDSDDADHIARSLHADIKDMILRGQFVRFKHQRRGS
jgi:hypothetical protein